MENTKLEKLKSIQDKVRKGRYFIMTTGKKISSQKVWGYFSGRI